MNFKEWIRNTKDGYVVRQVKNIVLPRFELSPIIHRRFVFHGRVQKVGFRLEIFELAKRLELSGWVRNRMDGTVEAQFQGEENKVDFLVAFMKSLKRAKVTKIDSFSISFHDASGEFIVRDDCV